MRTYSLAIVVALACDQSARAQTSFTGSPNTLFESANWDNGLPTLANQGTLSDDSLWPVDNDMDGWDLVITGGILTDEANTFTVNEIYGGTVIDLQGGTWNRNATARLHGACTINVNGGAIDWNQIAAISAAVGGGQDGGFFVNVNAGLFDLAQMINYNNQANPSVITVNGGSATLGFGNNDTRAIDEANNRFIVNGGTLELYSFRMNTDLVNDIDNNITIAGGAVTIGAGGYQPNTTDGLASSRYINFTESSTGSLTIAGADQAAFEALYANGTLLRGLDNTQPFSVAFSVVGDTITAPTPPDPVLAIASGDLDFGLLYHPTGTDATSRTITFTNLGASEDLTIDTVSLTNDAGGIYSITSAPAESTVIAPAGTFDVEITAIGGSGYTSYTGELLIDVSHAGSPANDQDATVLISSTIATVDDPYLVVSNPGLENSLASWNGNAVSTDGLGSGEGARVRGDGDDRNAPGVTFTSNLAQAFSFQNSPDFTASLLFAIPDADFTELTPLNTNYDRSFHLAILAEPTLPGAGAFDNNANADTIINLFYFLDGVPSDTTPGFFLYDSSAAGGSGDFVRLAGLGTILPSTGYNLDGSPPTNLNTYQLTVTGTGFGTPTATYGISISDANMTNVAASVTGLTTFHGTDPTSATAKAIVLTTADSTTASETNPVGNAYQATFWVDDIDVALNQTLPLALVQEAKVPNTPHLLSGQTGSITFTLTNTGFGHDLSVNAGAFNDSRFSFVTALPASIPSGESQTFEIAFDGSSESSPSTFTESLTLTLNDPITPTINYPLSVDFINPEGVILIDFDDEIPGNGMHDASIRNGGFEDGMADDTFADTPFWESRFEDFDVVPQSSLDLLTLDVFPSTGDLHGYTTGFAGTAANRRQPAQLFELSEWTIQEGDVFEVQYDATEGSFPTGADQGTVIIEVFDRNGNLVNDSLATGNTPSRIVSLSQPLTNPTDWETFTVTTIPIRADSPWIGHRPLIRLLKNDTRDSDIYVDNVFARAYIDGAIPSALAITHFSVNPSTKDVTIRFTNTGADSYSIESDADFDFSAGSILYPLDGSEDTTTYPDEIEFSFNDPTITGSGHAFRVVAD